MSIVAEPKRKPVRKATAKPVKTWAERIVAQRKRLGLKQDQMADMIGIPVRTLMSWEYDHRQPSRLAQLRLLQVFPGI